MLGYYSTRRRKNPVKITQADFAQRPAWLPHIKGRGIVLTFSRHRYDWPGCFVSEKGKFENFIEENAPDI